MLCWRPKRRRPLRSNNGMLGYPCFSGGYRSKGQQHGVRMEEANFVALSTHSHQTTYTQDHIHHIHICDIYTVKITNIIEVIHPANIGHPEDHSNQYRIRRCPANPTYIRTTGQPINIPTELAYIGKDETPSKHSVKRA